MPSAWPAPDFSTGGEIVYDRAEMENIYNTGRGSFKVRARWRYVQKENIIEIYEIPYTTTTEAIVDKVAELIKAGKVREVNDMRDETDLSGLKLAIDLKRGTDPEKLMQKLFRLTPLMDSFPCNFNILVAGNPKVMGVREILSEWSAWRMECVRRRVYFDLSKKKDKLILKRVSETEELEKAIEELEETLKSRRKIKSIIVNELKQVIKKYPCPRRTGIVYANEIEEFEETELVEDYPVTVFISNEGYFKKITPLSLRMNSEQKFKDGDGLKMSFESSNRMELLIFTDQQRVYKTKLSDFDNTKASDLGVYLPTKLEMEDGERILSVVCPGDYKKQLLLFFENGKIARLEMSAYETKTNRKKLINAYSDKSPLVEVMPISEDINVAMFSTDGRALVFNTSLLQLKTSRTTQGVAGMSLKKNHKLNSAVQLESTVIKNVSRYRVRSLPAAGALLKDEDRGEEQMSLIN